MRKFLSIFLAVTMLLSLVAPFRAPTAQAAVSSITITDGTKKLEWFGPTVPDFGTAGTYNLTSGLYIYNMGDVIHGKFHADAAGQHTIQLVDTAGTVVDSVTVNVPAAGDYLFTIGTGNVSKDGLYRIKGGNVTVDVFIKYNIVTTTPTLQTCVGTSVVSGWITRGNGQTVLVPVDVYVTYPDNKLAGYYTVATNSSGQFTITFPSDENGNGVVDPSEIGKFRIFVRDGYDPAFDPDNDAIIYKTFSNTPTTKLTLSTYITPFIYKNTTNQPLLVVAKNQDGNFVTGITSFTVTNATYTVAEISPGFYRFLLNVGNVSDVRIKASYAPYGDTINSNELIINTRTLGVYNPYIDITAPDAIAPYGDNTPWTLDSVQSVYDKLPCTIGNSFNMVVDYYDPVDTTNWQIHDFSYEVNGPVVDEGNGKYLVTGVGKISVSMSFVAWERSNKAENCPISSTNACCHTFDKTVDICETQSCTYGGVTLTGNTVDSTTVEVGKKVDKLSISIDPAGAPADLTCSCPNYVIAMYMTDAEGNIVSDAFTVDTYTGQTATGGMIWYNPQGATGPNIPDQPVQTFLPSGIYTGYDANTQVSNALKFGDCPFNLYGIKFNYPTGTSCGYSLVVKVFGLERTFDACGTMIVKYPLIAEDFDPITVLPTVKTLSATGKIFEGQQDPDSILAGVSTVIDITNPGFSGTPTWKFSLNGTSVSGVSFSSTDTGYRFSNICLNKAGTFKIYGYYYSDDCTVKEEVTLEFKVVAPEFTVELGLMDGSKIPSDGILTEGFNEVVYVTPKDPRGIHDFTSADWSLDASVKNNSCGLTPAVVFESSVAGECCGREALGLQGFDNPCVDDKPMVDLYFVSECGAKIYITSFELVPPTIKVDPAEVPFTIPATTTHVTFTVTDAHAHGAPGVNVVISGNQKTGLGFSSGASGYTWSAVAGTTGTKGEVDWGFVPPFSGLYTISADLPSNKELPCGWTELSNSATLEAVYKAPVVDTTAPVVEASAPAEVTSPTVKVTGKVTDNVGVTQLWIGATQVSFAPDGTFEATVALNPGANTIKVVAYDAAGNKGEKVLTVTYKQPIVTKIVLKIGSDIMTVNGRVVQLDAAPEIKDGRTFLPLRAIAEAFGAQVTWIPDTQGITVVLGDNQIGLQIGNNSAVVNGNVLTIVPPYIKNGRTMVPIRVIAEGLGATVEWDPVNYIVTITMEG